MVRAVRKKQDVSQMSPSKPSTRGTKRSTRSATKANVPDKNVSIVKKSVPKVQRKSLRKPANVISDNVDEKTTSKRKSLVEKNRPKSSTANTKSEDKPEVVPKTRRTVQKRNDEDKSKTTTTKRTVKKVVSRPLSSFRQTSLRESFQNQSKSRRLRPRRVQKNYRDETLVSDKDTLTDVKTNVANQPRVPVYKTIPVDESVNNGSEVYEFKPDKDDVRQRKKKKKRAKETVVQKLMKARKKEQLKKTLLLPENVPVVLCEKIKEKKEEKPLEKVPENIDSNIEEHVNNENIENVTTDDLTHLQQNVEKPHEKPRIVTVEKVNKKVTIINSIASPDTNDFKPFRPTNVFGNKLSVQNTNLGNYSLLEKSVSPIVKTARNFDPGSPWRAPPLHAFSHLTNFYQSTPQNKKLSVTVGRLQRDTNEPKNVLNTTKTKSSLQKVTDNEERENGLILTGKKKKSIGSSRKFGTEITNIDQSIPIENRISDATEKLVAESEPLTQNTDMTGTNNTDLPDANKLDVTENKENSALSYQTPKKVLKRKYRKIPLRSPLKLTSNLENIINKENNDPIPGPSGLQKMSPEKQQNEPVVLRQLNLNNFLNIMDAPESTTIKTPHAIFGDTHSPPISGNSIKKKDTEIEKGFGFSDDDTEQESSKTETYSKENVCKPIIKSKIKKNIAPARISIGEIKNYLITRKANENTQNHEVSSIDQENKTSPIKTKAHNVKFDVSNFSDTFDILSETGESHQELGNSIPLFADLEPLHFTQPARHSYKRKRNMTYNFLEESGSEGEEEHSKVNVKRTKTKKSKEDEKRLRKWINDVNRTFTEIDEYDLVVE